MILYAAVSNSLFIIWKDTTLSALVWFFSLHIFNLWRDLCDSNTSYILVPVHVLYMSGNFMVQRSPIYLYMYYFGIGAYTSL